MRHICCIHVVDYFFTTTPMSNKLIAERIGCSESLIDRRWRSTSDHVRAERRQRREEAREARGRRQRKRVDEAQALRDLGATTEQIAEAIGEKPHWVLTYTRVPSCMIGLRDAKKKRIVEAYQEPGASVRSVAKLTGVDHDTVARIVREAGATKRPARERREQKLRAVVALREQGVLYREIKDLLGVPIGTAAGWVRKHGGGA